MKAALEVALKCSVEAGTVWAQWGLSLLQVHHPFHSRFPFSFPFVPIPSQAGMYSEAREKLAHCFPSPGGHSLLSRIISTLESSQPQQLCIRLCLCPLNIPLLLCCCVSVRVPVHSDTLTRPQPLCPNPSARSYSSTSRPSIPHPPPEDPKFQPHLRPLPRHAMIFQELSLSSTADTSKGSVNAPSANWRKRIDDKAFAECLYYLRKYGTIKEEVENSANVLPHLGCSLT